MHTRTNIVDFATYRFARDLRLGEARAEETRRLAALTETELSPEATAHRERMLRHLAQGTQHQH
jgi:hypothetical protein